MELFIINDFKRLFIKSDYLFFFIKQKDDNNNNNNNNREIESLKNNMFHFL